MRREIPLLAASVLCVAIMAVFAVRTHIRLKNIEANYANPQELDSEYTASIVEEFTSDHSGIMQGYVLIHFPGMGKEKDLTFRLHESRAKELVQKINGSLAGIPRLLEEK